MCVTPELEATLLVLDGASSGALRIIYIIRRYLRHPFYPALISAGTGPTALSPLISRLT